MSASAEQSRSDDAATRSIIMEHIQSRHSSTTHGDDMSMCIQFTCIFKDIMLLPGAEAQRLLELRI